ncbi:hypothetical protein [Hydrogenophaga sp.]|uniref:hypothetical protein n=1 Tax=Hydrogenophaga sp. TaxID=1904254 RepID=UPI00272534B3|nr:hypothetical protein [Hydrogenophaga sp.]MDO9604966.1 hypothetical protein [Hydrogenophaga sp.]
MTATEFLLTAYGMALANDQPLHEKWIALSFALGAVAGDAHLVALQRNGRLDLMLRLLETERLERIKNDSAKEAMLSLDLQVALSENWLLSAYEVARAAKAPFKASGNDASRLLALEHRLALVRMPVAKGVIQGMDRKPYKNNPPLLMKVGDDMPKLYQDDGSYMAPCGLCVATGAVLWYPADITGHKTAPICRRELSDEMLALFD